MLSASIRLVLSNSYECSLTQGQPLPSLQVLELMELAPLRSALVGVPGVSGLSVEQRKRLTIGVELVANPSIIFMVGHSRRRQM